MVGPVRHGGGHGSAATVAGRGHQVVAVGGEAEYGAAAVVLVGYPGLSRRHWQMLHSLADGPRPADEVRDGLAPFWTDPAEWEIQLAQLVDRGLVVDEAGTLALTDAGRATHEEAFARIGRRRRAMVDGITDEQYVETVRILEKMAANMAGDMNPRVCAAPVHIAM